MEEQKTAAQALATFLEEYKKQDWKAMLSLCQPTWKAELEEPEDKLKQILGPFPLVSFKIGAILAVNLIGLQKKDVAPEGSIVDVEVDLVREGPRSELRQAVLIRVICEKEAYEPSLDGTWSVNPVSIRTRWK